MISSTCERYGYSIEYVGYHLTTPQIYLLLDGWNCSNLDGYGVEMVDTRPPKPDGKTDRQGELEWGLRYDMGLTDADEIRRLAAKQVAKEEKEKRKQRA